MIIACSKCGTSLTSDLYPTKKTVNKIYDDSISEITLEIPRGAFMLYKNVFNINSWNADSALHVIVNPFNFIDREQLIFKSGWGCCGNSYVSVKCHACNELVGEQFLDCYEFKHIHFNPKKIQRKFKK